MTIIRFLSTTDTVLNLAMPLYAVSDDEDSDGSGGPATTQPVQHEQEGGAVAGVQRVVVIQEVTEEDLTVENTKRQVANAFRYYPKHKFVLMAPLPAEHISQRMGAQLFAEALERQPEFEHMRLVNHYNNPWIDVEGAKTIATALRDSQTLKTFHIVAMHLPPEGAAALLEALTTTPQLQRLELSLVHIDGNLATSIIKLLRKSKTLRYLSLEGANLHETSIIDLMRALKGNTALRYLGLKHNEMGPEACRAIGNFLNSSTTLRVMDLSGCHVDDEGARAIAVPLETNRSLEGFHFPTGPTTAHAPFRSSLRTNLALTDTSLINHAPFIDEQWRGFFIESLYLVPPKRREWVVKMMSKLGIHGRDFLDAGRFVPLLCDIPEGRIEAVTEAAGKLLSPTMHGGSKVDVMYKLGEVPEEKLNDVVAEALRLFTENMSPQQRLGLVSQLCFRATYGEMVFSEEE